MSDKSSKYARSLSAALKSRLALAFIGAWTLPAWDASANPVGGTVTQGSASFNNSGSTLTIKTSGQAVINWQSFNIGLGQTTTFVEPSSSSVVWNQINDIQASQILGNLNANGYVVLQNKNGFYVGGQAAISARGLVMTTSPSAPPMDLSSGGPWSFNTLPPTAKIINYGQINVGNGGSAYLIANDIENNGSISAPGGNIGLCAGQTVLLSQRPDGRGLSAQVKLPQGSVDNQGRLTADAGNIYLNAQVVNQGGLVQANSVREVNGVIELVASDAVNLSAGSSISAQGDTQGTSSGGSVIIKAGNTFTDQPGSSINIAGGALGGNGGQVEISAASVDAIQSTIDGHAANGFRGGEFTLDPYNLQLTSALVKSLTPTLNSGLYQINLQADNILEVSTAWSLSDPGGPALLTLTAGNNIILDPGSSIQGGNNWSVTLNAGAGLTSAADRQSGSDGIYLLGNSFIKTQNGNISLTAGNEILLNAASDDGNDGNPVMVTQINGNTVDVLNSGTVGNVGIRTTAGGSITAVATYGDVNTGGNFNGFNFHQQNAPYYSVNTANLGGISTGAGGNVTITAGGNIISFLPLENNWTQAQFDGGTGAFGANPGNVTITAGGRITGHFVLANGTGTITSQDGNIGPTENGDSGFALSLISGNWSVNAPKGNIVVQDVRNPNGIFNDGKSGSATTPQNTSYAGYHLFNYDPASSVLFDAGGSVEINPVNVPHTPPSDFTSPIPLIFPPTFTVIAGSGGFNMDQNVILFPSASGNLSVTTKNGGNFEGNGNYLEMSDSAATQYDPNANSPAFGLGDHAASPIHLNDLNPVQISVSGDLDNVTLYTAKETKIDVAGNAFNANLVGENLHPSDVTCVNVAGSISYSPSFVFAKLSQPIVSADPVVAPNWDTIFSLLVDPNAVASLALNGNENTTELDNAINAMKLFKTSSQGLNPFSYNPSQNPGFLYDPSTRQLAFQFQMLPSTRDALTGPLEIIKVNPQTGLPVLQPGQASLGQDPSKFYFATTTVGFVPPSVIQTLYSESQNSLSSSSGQPAGFQIGGPGKLNIKASSIDLGSSIGILSLGVAANTRGEARDYSSLAGVTPLESGAAIKVTTTGDLNMLSSTIASVFGGDVTINSGGNVNLSQGSFNLPINGGIPAYGIYTSGHSDVFVTAQDDVNIGSSRIGAFNGGSITVTSWTGNVNAGNGANSVLLVPIIDIDPVTGAWSTGTLEPFGSGILSIAPTPADSWDHKPVPGDITVNAPRGNIVSTLGGIEQFTLGSTTAPGPVINLVAGSAATATSPAYPGNIDLGVGGVLGGTVNLTAQGNISGFIVSRDDSHVNAAQNFVGTVLSGGTANLSAGGSVAGTVIGISGVNASSGGANSASILGQNVSVNGGATQSTLAGATATGASQSAAQQASTETKQMASNDTGANDDEKKKGKRGPFLARRMSRVTVILPPKTM